MAHIDLIRGLQDIKLLHAPAEGDLVCSCCSEVHPCPTYNLAEWALDAPSFNAESIRERSYVGMYPEGEQRGKD